MKTMKLITLFVVLLMTNYLLVACVSNTADRTKSSIEDIVVLVLDEVPEESVCSSFYERFEYKGEFDCTGEEGYYQLLSSKLSGFGDSKSVEVIITYEVEDDVIYYFLDHEDSKILVAVVSNDTEQNIIGIVKE